MTLPSELKDWLQYKYEHDCSTIYDSGSITHVYKKHTGGMIIFAGLTLTVFPSDSFELELPDADVEDSYISGIKDGIISSLFVINEKPLFKIKITVSELKTTIDGSSYMAFYNVSKEAMVKVIDQLYT